MKFDDLANSILKEDNARRSAAGLDMDGVIASHDSYYKDKDKEEEMDPLTDPMFQKALDILEDLQARSPDKFEKFITRLNDLVDFKRGVSL